MKNRHKKTAVPNKVRFGIAVVLYYSFVRSAAQKARRKKFMLRKWQHRQVAPLAIQTPTHGGLCIGCAVLPAQREYPPRPPRNRAYAHIAKASAGLYAEALIFSISTFPSLKKLSSCAKTEHLMCYNRRNEVEKEVNRYA
ncbi:hypothetical protein [Ruminococcus albus]|nr:hypothetical protein [Ruminococcus albus]